MLTKKDFQNAKCECAGCGGSCSGGEIYLHSQCHPDAPTWTKYDPAFGAVVIECSICKKPIAAIKVAEE